MDANLVSALRDLTEIVAAHGIYAIFVVFLFYLERRAAKRVAEARSEPQPQQDFAKRIYVVVLAMVIVLAVGAAGTWIYETFIYHVKLVIEGSYENFPHDGGKEPPPGGKVIDVQANPLGEGISYYIHEKSSNELNWVVLAAEDRLIPLEIGVSHTCVSRPDDKRPSVQGKAGENPASQAQRWELRGVITIPADEVRGKRLQLFYKLNAEDPCRRFGKFCFIEDKGGCKALPILDLTGSPLISASAVDSLLAPRSAWAGDEASPSDARLAEHLASRAIGEQLAAEKVLIAHGAAALPLIESLLASAKPPADHAQLIESVADALEKLQAQRIVVSPKLQLVLARGLYEIGDFAKASRHFKEVPTAGLTPELLLMRGAADTRAGDYDRALDAFYAYGQLAKDPRAQVLVLANISTVLMLQHKDSEAHRTIEQAMNIDPTDSQVLRNLAILDNREGRHSDAAGILEKLVKRNPERTDLKVNLAFAYEHLPHRTDDAIGLLESVVRSSPEDPFAENNLASMYAEKESNLQRALGLADKALAAYPGNPAFLDTKGVVLLKLGQLDDSDKLFQEALRQMPKEPVLLKHLADLRQAFAERQARQRVAKP